uniref:Uncharacterized protein n=1 Tax=Ditylenchus dipsaci TaxID=166011 RepID=A0A915CMB7_9BILA
MTTVFIELNSTAVPVVPEEETPEIWQTWFFGILIVTAASFLSPLGMLMVPLLSKSLYNRCMIFLVALGIGAMSGSCIFILLPQAFNITELSKFNYITKCWLILFALYGFFVVDRILSVVLELKRRRNCRRKVHMSTISAILGRDKKKSAEPQNRNSQINQYTDYTARRPSGDNVKNSALQSNNSNVDAVEEMEMQRMHDKESQELEDELEVAMISNALTRTFSTRKSYAVVREEHENAPTPDKIQFQSEDGTMYDIDAKSLSPKEVELNTENGEIGADSSRKQFSHRDTQTELASNGFNNHYVKNSTAKKISTVASNWNTNTGAKTSVAGLNDHSRKQSKSSNRGAEDREIGVSIQIHDKLVIDKARLEVASVAYMIIFGSSANNFVDGMSTGAAFSDSIVRGVTIGLAVLSQQFPQELGTLAILVNSGLGVKRAIMFNMIPITLSYLGFAAGVMLDTMDDSLDDFIFLSLWECTCTYFWEPFCPKYGIASMNC